MQGLYRARRAYMLALTLNLVLPLCSFHLQVPVRCFSRADRYVAVPGSSGAEIQQLPAPPLVYPLSWAALGRVGLFLQGKVLE